jgi:ABC-2 type transport system permease protein
MAKLWAVIQREFMERVRTRWFVISTLLGPLFFAGITVLPAWLALRERGSSEVANVTIIDATGTDLGERIARALRDSAAGAAAPGAEVLRVTPAGVADAERRATEGVVRKARRGYLVLDSATLAGERARYAGRNASSDADMERLREAVRQQALAVRLERAGLDAGRVTALTGTRLRMPTERIGDRGREGSGVGNAVVAVALVFLLYIVIIIYGQNVLRSVLEEKTTRVAEVILSSVKPDVLMAGKVLGVGAVGLVQQILWFAGAAYVGSFLAPFLARAARSAGPGASGAPPGRDAVAAMLPSVSFGTIAAYLLFFLLGYILYSTLFAAVGAMVNSEQEAQQAAFPVMMPLILSAVFMQVVLRNPEAGAAKFAAWFPLTAPVIMPMRIGLVGPSTLEIAAVLTGLALTCLLAIWVAARIYRVGLLMYGKRPTPAELMRWVRYAR